MTFFNPEIKDYKYTSYENPYQKGAPWPAMRGDIKSSGRLKNLKWKGPSPSTDEVIHFHTDNAIFSTPIIDSKERIYLGSADHYFYCFDPNSSQELWRFDAGEIIDSAACIGKDGTVYVGTGSAKVHAFTPEGKQLWHYDALNNRRKEQFTFSTNYWFEANIVLGPDGALYVANDDFFLYKMTPHGDLIWGYRTGFLIWSASSFGKDGSVYSAGFDHLLYSLDMDTGELKWKTDLKGSLVGSPSIGEQGTLYQTSFNGNIFAICPQNGAEYWKYETGSHIYASAAISPDEKVYFGSTNGMFYCLDGNTGLVEWTYYIGDPIRSSASLGPDPEEKEEYLVYFGGGDGIVYALEPNGIMRWSYNTLLKASNTDYPNINASIALGHHGLVVASSTGDVIWIPYNYYLRANAEGINKTREGLTQKEGFFWHYVNPGGSLKKDPLEDETYEIDPTSILSLRLIQYDKQGHLPVNFAPKSVKIEIYPYINHTWELQSDMSTLHIIPNIILKPDTEYLISISGKYSNRRGKKKTIQSELRFKTRIPPQMASLLSSPKKTFKIEYMAVPQPNIVPSLDQIGLASLSIPFSIIESNPEEKTFTAFAVQKFGEVGVPQKRISLYAFTG